MPLRIAVDARRVSDFGIGTYIRNLIRSLAWIDRDNRYLVITTAPAPELADLPENFETSIYSRRDRTRLAQVGFSFFLRTLKADLYHVPLNAVPLWMPKPYLVTTHDMSTLLFLDQTGYRSNIRRFFLRRGLQRAARVMAVSNTTRADVAEVLGIPISKIQVVYNAPDPTFHALETALDSAPTDGTVAYPPEIQRVLERYHIHYPFLLYVGRTNAQKNIPRLVEAFAVLRGELQDNPTYRDLRLIIIGDEIARQPALRHAVILSRVEAAVRFLGFVPIETLRAFYQLACAFVFPSLYEGFGLPPLEAMACGTPVVCSNVSALPEVVGEAAVRVNPENVFDIARGIREVLLDPALRRKLVVQGLEQATKFSWERTAREVHQAYIEVASYKNRPR